MHQIKLCMSWDLDWSPLISNATLEENLAIFNLKICRFDVLETFLGANTSYQLRHQFLRVRLWSETVASIVSGCNLCLIQIWILQMYDFFFYFFFLFEVSYKMLCVTKSSHAVFVGSHGNKQV